MKVISLKEAQRIDNRAIYELGVPRAALMENAGRGAAEILLKKIKGLGSVVVVSGAGYNGGDGLVAARHLHINGLRVKLFLVANTNKVKNETLVQLRVLEGLGLRASNIENVSDIKPLSLEIARADILIDALMGIGIKGEIREPQKSVIELINKSKIKVLSVDIPSGLDSDSGIVGTAAIKADWTVTFKDIKRGMVSGEGRRHCGKVYVRGIGI
ncbi:MAG: NAD(P)H-hydrate epimerase [Candidatus Kaelpia aquatica]|nr:NAD(P)H-hydrate epimerase [Candidatus Kaelpia aquatica]